QQVPAALGVSNLQGEKVWAIAAQAVQEFLAEPNPAPVVVALSVTAIILVGARWRPSWPFSLVAVAIATGAAVVGPFVLKPLGAIPAGLPAPSLAFFDAGAIGALSTAAVAVAALAALES